MGAQFAESIAARGATTVISYANDGSAAEELAARLKEHQVTVEAIRSDATSSAEVAALFGRPLPARANGAMF